MSRSIDRVRARKDIRIFGDLLRAVGAAQHNRPNPILGYTGYTGGAQGDSYPSDVRDANAYQNGWNAMVVKFNSMYPRDFSAAGFANTMADLHNFAGSYSTSYLEAVGRGQQVLGGPFEHIDPTSVSGPKPPPAATVKPWWKFW